MLRIFGFFVFVGVLTFGAIQLADNPGAIAIEWLGYRIDTYFGIALIALFIGLWLVIALYRMFRGLLGLPGGFMDRRATRRRDQGVNALSLGMAAIAAGDAEEARKQARRAEKLLDDPAKTRLLSAQAAALGGDTAAADRYFDALTERPETKFVGLVGKLRQALEAGDTAAALPLARQARNLRPDSAFAARSLFTLETGAEDWDEAQKTLFDAVRRDLIPEDEAKRYRIAIDMERARLRDLDGDAEAAADFAARALKVDPGFVPAVRLVARADQKNGRARKAQRLVEDAWRAAPHPELARLYSGLWPEDDPAQRFKRLQKLTGSDGGGAVGRVALAETAIAAELWGDARAALERIPSDERTATVYRLLAYLAQAEHGDAAEARGLLEQAGTAPPDATWTCEDCGATASDWSVICGNCGNFASLTWKQPPRVSTLVSLPPETDMPVPDPELLTNELEAVAGPAPDPAPETVAAPPVTVPESPEPLAEGAAPKQTKTGDGSPNPEDVVRRLA